MNQFDQLFNTSGLSLDRMRSFLMVYEAGTLSKAAQGDQAKQSQFSRQIKELEEFFGVALTRRIGRQIEITEAGRRLATIIQRQFTELNDFKKLMSGLCITVRIGAQGPVFDWSLIPLLPLILAQLGSVSLEFVQMQTTEVVCAVADGSLCIGVVREDAISPETKCYRLGGIGYVVVGANAHWEGCDTATDLLRQAPVVELLPGGKFAQHWQQWLNKEKIQPNVVTKVPSFSDAARIALSGQAVAVLPEIALIDFDAEKFKHQKIDELKALKLALIWNTRSLERGCINETAVHQLAQILTYDTTDTIF